MVYEFQCHRCFIVSGRMSTDPNDAPLCCGGEQMVAYPMDEGNLTQRAANKRTAPLNYEYTPGVGHYKNCPVCVGECVCS